MRAHVSTSKNGMKTYYVTEGIRTKDKVSTRIVLTVGSDAYIRAQGHSDPLAYTKELAEKMTAEKKQKKLIATMKVDLTKKLPPEGRRTTESTALNIGWLYIKHVWDTLGMSRILDQYQGKKQYSVSGLALTGTAMRIMDPASKDRTLRLAKNYMGMETGTENDIIRLLSVLSENADDIQEKLRENSKRQLPRPAFVIRTEVSG